MKRCTGAALTISALAWCVSAVAALVGSASLSSALSQAVFSNSEAELILTYSGSDVDVGIERNTLRQDLMVGLSGGPMSIGSMA